VFEDRVLTRIFGPKRDEVTGGWRKLHNEEFRSLYSFPNIIRMIKSQKMRWACSTSESGDKCIKGFGGKIRRKETARKTRRKSNEGKVVSALN
jgi:hypothetical protein